MTAKRSEDEGSKHGDAATDLCEVIVDDRSVAAPGAGGGAASPSDLPTPAEPQAPAAAPKEKDKEKELADLQDRYLRVAADFDNFKKRAAKERQELLKYANENLAKQLLEVLDNLERARSHAETADKESLLHGVQLVETIALQTLEKFGIRRYSALNKPFDPAHHEAVQEVSAEAPAGSVLYELQKGYTYHDRLLRPSRVVLSKGPAPAPSSEPKNGAESGQGGESLAGEVLPVSREGDAQS